MSDQPAVLWTPPANVRETTEVGRYLGWLEGERGLAFRNYDELWRWSVDDLPGFWSSIWDFFGVSAHSPYRAVLADSAMPGATWFPGSRLNFAEHLMGHRRGRASGWRSSPTPRPGRNASSPSPTSGSRSAAPARSAAARGGTRRPGGRVHAKHPRDAGGVRGDGEPRRDLGELRTRAGPAQRHRPPRPARPDRPAHGGGLRLPGPLHRPPRRGGYDPCRSPHPASRGPRPLRRARGRGGPHLGRAPLRDRAPGLRAGPLRPPPLRPLLLGHHGTAEGDHPRPWRHPAGVPQVPRSQLGPEAGGPFALVLDDLVDDVERAGRRPRRARRRS